MALSDKEFLQVAETLVEKWAELVVKEIREDIARIDELDVIDQLYLRSYWRKHNDLLLEIHKLLKKSDNPPERLQLIAEMFGDQIGLPSSELKADVAARLDWLKRRTAKEFEQDIKQAINFHDIASPIEQIVLIEWKFARVEQRLGLRLVPQKTIKTDRGEYSIDFAVLPAKGDESRIFLAIELDGHQFHEKTSKQATRDKVRDRALLRAGVAVLRFSGYEIVRDARQCIREVEDYLSKGEQGATQPQT